MDDDATVLVQASNVISESIMEKKQSFQRTKGPSPADVSQRDLRFSHVRLGNGVDES